MTGKIVSLGVAALIGLCAGFGGAVVVYANHEARLDGIEEHISAVDTNTRTLQIILDELESR